MSRDKQETMQRLIDAVGQIIREDGFAAVGVNAVAKRADVDKVLIYRYFGDLEGLLASFAEQKDFYGRLDDILGDVRDITGPDDVLALTKKILIGQLRHLREHPELREILKWELSTRNAATERIAEARERQGTAITHVLSDNIRGEGVDAAALMSIISAGIYYLVLRADTVDVYNGVPLDSEEGWRRLEDGLLMLVEILGKEFFA